MTVCVCVLAVRFGRVPKREKAKILEQMQRVNVQCQGSLVDSIVADEVCITSALALIVVARYDWTLVTIVLPFVVPSSVRIGPICFQVGRFIYEATKPGFTLSRSTLLSRPNKVGLKCLSVLPSTKSFFDFNEMWCVGRGRRVMHDGMQYDLIQGQGQRHEHFKVGNPSIFKSCVSFYGQKPKAICLGNNEQVVFC